MRPVLVALALALVLTPSWGVARPLTTDVSSAGVQIVAPVELATVAMPSAFADFAPLPPPFTGLKAYVSTSVPANGCTPFANPEIVSNTIVLIDRGGCDFLDKAINAQNAGALGFIFSNIVDETLPVPSWAHGREHENVRIPGLLVHGVHGNIIRKLLKNDVPVRVALRGPLMCPPTKLN